MWAEGLWQAWRRVYLASQLDAAMAEGTFTPQQAEIAVASVAGIEGVQTMRTLALTAYSEGFGSVAQYEALISTVFNRMAEGKSLEQVLNKSHYQALGNAQYRDLQAAFGGKRSYSVFMQNAVFAAVQMLQPGITPMLDAHSYWWSPKDPTKEDLTRYGRIDPTPIAVLASPAGSKSGNLLIFRRKVG